MPDLNTGAHNQTLHGHHHDGREELLASLRLLASGKTNLE